MGKPVAAPIGDAIKKKFFITFCHIGVGSVKFSIFANFQFFEIFWARIVELDELMIFHNYS
jgi:hypothetical protein